jgi:hypothetical protein
MAANVQGMRQNENVILSVIKRCSLMTEVEVKKDSQGKRETLCIRLTALFHTRSSVAL